MADRGADLAFGRTLPRLLRERGLVDVAADALLPARLTRLRRAGTRDVRRSASGSPTAGLATDAEIDQHLANIDAGRLDLATSPVISAWGRKPTPQHRPQQLPHRG